MSCSNCPCPDVCLKWDVFCLQAAKAPQEEMEIKHICARSAMGELPPRMVRRRYPPLRRQWHNFVWAMQRWARTGFKVVHWRETKRRWDICRGCEFLSPMLRCTKCGCSALAKPWMASEKCPVGKWEKSAEERLCVIQVPPTITRPMNPPN